MRSRRGFTLIELAAAGLASTGDDGRFVHMNRWTDDLTRRQPVAAITRRGISVLERASGRMIDRGVVDLGKKLRPNCRAGQVVLFAESAGDEAWTAFRLV
jgi:hypothetical protein